MTDTSAWICDLRVFGSFRTEIKYPLGKSIIKFCRRCFTKQTFPIERQALGSDGLIIFKRFRVIFSLKTKTILFPLSFSLYFQQKRAPKLPIYHLPTKRSVWLFDVTNRTNGFFSFQSYHKVVMHLFNSLAKSCTVFWKYS